MDLVEYRTDHGWMILEYGFPYKYATGFVMLHMQALIDTEFRKSLSFVAVSKTLNGKLTNVTDELALCNMQLTSCGAIVEEIKCISVYGHSDFLDIPVQISMCAGTNLLQIKVPVPVFNRLGFNEFGNYANLIEAQL